MELQTIAERTRLPLRKLRYVIDHRLLPGLRVKIDGKAVGQPRYFTDFEAFAVACAAAMLVGGMKREAVVQCIDGLVDLTWEGEPFSKRPITELAKSKGGHVLSSLFTDTGTAVVMLGDGLNVRALAKSRDTGWCQPRTLARLSDDYQPMVIVQIDLAQLRDRLKHKA
jgi:hypothetical protein